jgi:hypothetical protein
VRPSTDESKIYSEKALSRELRNVSSIYMSKIESMEKELKRKEIVITTYDLKVKELSSRLAGDHDRLRLMTRMQEEIELLKGENWDWRMEHLKL